MQSELQNVPFACIEESKRSWKCRRAERKPGTNGNVGFAIKQRVKTTGHDIHPNYASILETDVKTNDIRLLPESLHSFLDKKSTLPKGLCITAGFLPQEQRLTNDVFCYIFAFHDLQSTFL